MNISELQQNLDLIRAWRKLELSHARSIAERHSGFAEQSYLCRSWIVMIYAHCDQSLKLISREYLKYLKSTSRKNYDHRTVWLAYFAQAAFKGRDESRYSLCGDSQSLNRMLHDIDSDIVFKSASFNYYLLRFYTEWILQTSFDHEQYKAFCNTLKHKRDAIAHGEEIPIKNINDCIEWHEPAISLLDSLVDATINTAVTHDNL